MACSDFTGQFRWLEMLSNDAFRDAVLCPFQVEIGGLVFATLVFGGVVASLYIRQRAFIIPAVLAIAIGGLVLPQVQSVGLQIALLIVLTAAGAIPVLMIYRISSR